MESSSKLKEEEEELEWNDVGNISMLDNSDQRCHITIQGRFVTILRNPTTSQIHAMDSICYHTGGPLGVGDIEEVDGRMCITCPWHRHQVL